MTTQTTASERIIKLKDVITMTGLSRSSIYALIKKGVFPPQVKLTPRASGWHWQEVHEWLISRPRGSCGEH